jgi:hypothetical protein
MASIGGVTCTFLRGVVPPLKEEAALSRRPGIDGFEIQLTGLGDSAGQLSAVAYGTNAACVTFAASIAALQGQVVSVTDDHGTTRSGVFVHRVGQPRKTAARNGTTTHRVELPIEVLAVT